MYKLPKELVLNYKTWRCGKDANRENAHGKGGTFLKNFQGFECCLGQFAKQAGVPTRQIGGLSSPGMIKELVCGLNKKHIGGFENTRFSVDAMDVNDNEFTTVVEKIRRLTKLCKKHGRTLTVKNLPVSLQKQLGE